MILWVFILGFIAGAFLTRKSVWTVINGKAKFAVVPKEEVKTDGQTRVVPEKKTAV